MLPVIRKRFLLGFGLLIGLLLLITAYVLYADKFGEVGSSGVFRSAQLDAEDLEQWIEQHQIVSMINLRGANPDKQWYQQEQQVVKRLGLETLDIPLNGRILPKFRWLHKLVEALQTMPRPMLVHCQHGNDRAGLASIIVHLLTPGDTLEQAWQEVSVWRGVVIPDTVGRQFLNQYVDWLEEQGLSHKVGYFLDFAYHGYQDADGNLRIVLDQIGEQRIRKNNPSKLQIRVPENLQFVGWAYDPIAQEPLAAIEVIFDDRSLGMAEMRIPREDVAKALKMPAMKSSGWRLSVTQDQLSFECGQVQLELTRSNGKVFRSRSQAKVCFR